MMLSNRWRGLFVMALAFTLSLGLAGTAYAQGRDTGLAVVHAIDPDGAPLPGVMVVVTGPVGSQTQYTGVAGEARFPGLYPGDGYSATFTLDGFTTIIRDELTVVTGRIIDFTVTMDLATVEETITVTGESPLVDVKSTSVAGLVTSDLLDRTPTASGIWAGVMDKIPGVVASFDVGGGDSGQQQVNTAWGSEWRNNSYSVNGGDTTDPAAVGASSSYFSIGSFEEVSVSMAAQDIEIKTPGLNINMVVKSGSNDWHAGAKYFYENADMVSDNVTGVAKFEEAGITVGTPNVLLSDLDIQGGGPIWRDRAWFFADYWNFEVQKRILNLDEVDGTKLKDTTLNVNFQVSDNHKVSGRWLATQKYRNNRGASQYRPYMGRIQDSYSHIPQLQWQAVINQNVFADVRHSVVKSNFPMCRRWEPCGSEDAATPSTGSAIYSFGYGYIITPTLPSSEFFDERDTASTNGTVSWYITGENTSHDLKFGGNYQVINYFSPFNYPKGYRRYTRLSRVGSSTWDPDNNPLYATMGVPLEVRLYNAPIAKEDGGSMDCFVLGECWGSDGAYSMSGRALGIFFQDTITIANRWTISAGVRYDKAYNWNPAQKRLDSPWCGQTTGLTLPDMFCGGTFTEQAVAFEFNDITPRIGVVWDVTGDGTWALKANFSRYPEALGISYGGATNVNDVGSEDWNWYDPNGDGIFQFGEQTTMRSSWYPGEGTEVDPNLQAPLTDEYTVGVEHEIWDDILLSVTGIYRGRKDDVGTLNIGVPFGLMFDSDRCKNECTPVNPFGTDPWVKLSTVDPGDDGVIGTADDGGPIPIWAVNPNTYGTNNYLTTNPNEFGFSDNSYYRGISMVASKRWAGNWQMLASWDIGKAESEGSAYNPNSLWSRRRAVTGNHRQHILKLTANYLIAEPIGVNLGIFVRAQSGQDLYANYTYDNEILEALGPYGNQSNTSMTVVARGEMGDNQCNGCERPQREDFTTLVDVRAEKQFTIGKYGVVHFYFDVFNALNANTVTGLYTTINSRWMDITGLLPPRVMRIGGAWDF